ncbi:hypothetical protein CEXT_553491 [Caerostris extrusa]|uniref:Uncharacterized protein n=1 Tax=Caerostris extrusa TaxID=172846 RepID=A0AAV4Y0L4_CAEEX|nr:hypothetical protein CEXT_553491 [Caerostris extrusa]
MRQVFIYELTAWSHNQLLLRQWPVTPNLFHQRQKWRTSNTYLSLQTIFLHRNTGDSFDKLQYFAHRTIRDGGIIWHPFHSFIWRISPLKRRVSVW